MKVIPQRDKNFEEKASQPRFIEKLRLLFVEREVYHSEFGAIYIYKKLHNKYFISRVVMPDAMWVFSEED